MPGSRIVTYDASGHKIGAFVCYESAFPGLVRRFTLDGAQLLLNLSNDGYFGDSAAREQHLALVRMRAIENGRWILRATNDGITAMIDPAGRGDGAAAGALAVIAGDALQLHIGADVLYALRRLVPVGVFDRVVRSGDFYSGTSTFVRISVKISSATCGERRPARSGRTARVLIITRCEHTGSTVCFTSSGVT